MTGNNEAFDVDGLTVKDVDGSKIGEVRDYYFDAPTGQTEWLVVSTGLTDGKKVLVPMEGIVREEDELVTPYTKSMVMDAPAVEDASIDLETEKALYLHYNVRREPPGRTEDEAPWKQSDSVAGDHRLRIGSSRAA